MSYEDKVKHGVPSTIDEWVAYGKTRTNAPTANPHKRGPFGEYPLWQDDVECILRVIRKEEPVEGILQTRDEFTLTLRIRVPPTTAYLMHYWQSPTIIIDQYTRDPQDQHSPEWLKTVQTECRFWQSRTLMLEIIRYFAENVPHNARVSKRAKSWCNAMSTPVSNLLVWDVRPWRYFDPISLRNTRRHKPRASDLPAEESHNLRKYLNK
ncbi:hypothetical protein HYPSUDRAFT_152316, partial [Hypholoma sublateritium FD-334 SS-4]